MKEKRVEWTYQEFHPPTSWPSELLPKPRPLTKKQRAFLQECLKLIDEAKQWKQNQG